MVVTTLFRITGVLLFFAWVWTLIPPLVSAGALVRWDHWTVLQYTPQQRERVLENKRAPFLVGATTTWWTFFVVTLAAAKASPYWGLGTLALRISAAPTTLLAVCALCFLVQQIRVRGWLLGAMWRVVRAPFLTVEFKDILVADILTSLVVPMRDSVFVSCFISHGGFFNRDAHSDHYCNAITSTLEPIVTALPFIWRLMQCLRVYWESCPSAETYDVKLEMQSLEYSISPRVPPDAYNGSSEYTRKSKDLIVRLTKGNRRDLLNALKCKEYTKRVMSSPTNTF